MEECKNGNAYDFDLSDWSGKGGKVSENKLLESSAKWANLNDEKSTKTLNLLKSIVGETVVSKGKISVDYGPRKIGQTPRGYFLHLEKSTYKTLCDELLVKAVNQSAKLSFNQIIKDEDLKKVNGESKSIYLDRQTIRSLVYMPKYKRGMACKKLAKGIALTRFTKEMSDSLDFLYKSSQNVNLPEKRRRQIESKRQRLKDSVSETLELYEKRNDPLNKVLKRINTEGSFYVDKETKKELDRDLDSMNKSRLDALFWDCSDGFMCKGGN